MENATKYKIYDYDLAGSRTKNRFRVELLWGLDKIYQQYRLNDNFHMVFDYVCDIELHLQDQLEFYQLKTSGSSAFTINKLCAIKKKKNKNLECSILGKLYKIRLADQRNGCNFSKLAIVLNQPLTETQMFSSNDAEFEFSDFSKKYKDNLVNHLSKELNEENITLDNIYYINTQIPLKEPHEILLGKTMSFYQDIMKRDLIRPNILFSIFYEEITKKATYELQCDDYNQLLKNKGLSGQRIGYILEQYDQNKEDLVEACEKEISTNISDFKEKISWKKSLASLISQLRENLYLNNLEKEIRIDFESKLQSYCGNIIDIIDVYLKDSVIEYPFEFTLVDKKVFILIIAKKMEGEIDL